MQTKLVSLTDELLRRIDTISRKLDRAYYGGRGNEVAEISNRLLGAALAAIEDYDTGRASR